MAVTEPGPNTSEGQVSADPAPPVSPVQSRLRAMEIATRLLLLATGAIFAWAALSIFIRPFARSLIDEPVRVHLPGDNAPRGESPTDFYQSDDDLDDDSQPRATGPHRRPLPTDPAEDDDDKSDSKVKLVPGVARKDAKLHGQPSERSAEIGEVRAGESIFVMKEASDWVLVLRGEGAMLGWMRRENLEAR